MLGQRRAFRRPESVCLLALIGNLAVACQPRVEPLIMIAGPQGLTQFELRDSDDVVLWALEAVEPQSPDLLYYGLIPLGFEQSLPEGNQLPRPLVDGEVLSTTIVTRSLTFEHIGRAYGTNSFRAAHGAMKQPAAHPTPEQ